METRCVDIVCSVRPVNQLIELRRYVPTRLAVEREGVSRVLEFPREGVPVEAEVTSKPPPMAWQAGCLQGQDRSAATHPSSSHARRCLIRLFSDNRCNCYTAPLAIGGR
ncbi:hypothetical protein J6590_067588 [Homalodisca vitripennis]|nr:hypothetical protein J6590_067588 [Homalodisca vitripennis]